MRRVVQTIHFSYICIAGLAVALYYALTTSVIVDPLIGFLLAGIIPGTDIVLAPETVLLILTDIFGVAITVLLLGWIVRRRLMSNAVDPVNITQAAQVIKTPAAAAKVSRSKPVRHVRPSWITRQLAHISSLAASVPALKLFMTSLSALGWLAAAGVLTIAGYILALVTRVIREILFFAGLAILTIDFLLTLMLAGAVQVGRLLLRGVRIMLNGLVWSIVFVIVLLGTIIDACLKLWKIVWPLLVPYLQRIDVWLELAYRPCYAPGCPPVPAS